MNAQLAQLAKATTGFPFADVPQTAAEHFRLAFFGVVAHVIEVCTDGDRDSALATYPFLDDYADEIGERLPRSDDYEAQWRTALAAWENSAQTRLPLSALLQAGLSRLELELLLAAGLAEEDPRFSDLYEQAQGRERRPTLGLLLAWWRHQEDEDRAEEVRRSILNLVRAGLLQVLNPDAPRSEWTLAVPAPLWDALRGGPPVLPWLQHRSHEDLLPLKGYVASPAVMRMSSQLPRLLATQPTQILIVRGSRHNGRKTLLGAVAHALGKGMLVANGGVLDNEPRWRMFGALAVMLNALPVVELSLLAGENRSLPTLPFVTGTLAVATGAQGGIQTSDARALLTVTLPLPDAECRRRHWQTAVPTQRAAVLDELARCVLLTSGNIRRAALGATSYAQLGGRDAIEARDVQIACRGLHDARLETLATRLVTCGTLDDLAVDDVTNSELEMLVARCRHRETLATVAERSYEGGAHTNGVRALLSGPSGTGKTLAARLLASTLSKDLFRVDLSATVNKYLGETEKNLDQAFSAAEELDVVLLLDEGDALMAARTNVGSSNDRYANLETNFLLQRIESFGGILLVTTNAADRIDKAFARRMDVVIPFRAPDELRRYEILQLQLGTHAIDDEWLQELACRCVLTGGQLRNVVMHAQLLAMESRQLLSCEHLYAAVLREYRKSGAHCPLKLSG